LVRDTKVYLLGVWRAASRPILPFKYGATAQEIRATLEAYGAQARDAFDLGPVIDRARELEAVTGELDRLADCGAWEWGFGGAGGGGKPGAYGPWAGAGGDLLYGFRSL
jgi:hypothetical protein